MAQGKRGRLSTEQRIDMWRRWKAGESLHDIGRAFGKGHGSMRFLLTQRGGIVPAARRRSPRTLTCAISGDNDRWQGKTRRFANRDETEKELKAAGVLANSVLNEGLNALDKGNSAVFSVEPKAAISLQVAYRADLLQKKERTFITFHDLRGALLNQTKDVYLDREIQVGDVLSVDTPMGSRDVKVENIRKSEVKQFGSDEIRREVQVDVNF